VVQDLVLLVPGRALKLVWAVRRPSWAIQVKMSEILADVHVYEWYVVLGVSTGNKRSLSFQLVFRRWHPWRGQIRPLVFLREE
jgi:hypothetical protein